MRNKLLMMSVAVAGLLTGSATYAKSVFVDGPARQASAAAFQAPASFGSDDRDMTADTSAVAVMDDRAAVLDAVVQPGHALPTVGRLLASSVGDGKLVSHVAGGTLRDVSNAEAFTAFRSPYIDALATNDWKIWGIRMDDVVGAVWPALASSPLTIATRMATPCPAVACETNGGRDTPLESFLSGRDASSVNRGP